MAEKKNISAMFKTLQKEVAEAGTTSGLSDIEGQKVLVTDFFFTTSEQDNKPVVDVTIEGGRHVRSGGRLILDSFQKVADVMTEKHLSVVELLDEGYGLYATFTQRQSQNARNRFYWTVVLVLEPIVVEE